MQRNWIYSLAHYVAGLLSILSVTISPGLPFISTVIFLVYEINEDWNIRDEAWKDIREYMVAFNVGMAILLLIKAIG